MEIKTETIERVTITGKHNNDDNDIKAQTILVQTLGCRVVSVKTVGGNFMVVGERDYAPAGN